MFVNLSGFMFSGKSAFLDHLGGIEGIKSDHYQEEFDYFRVPGGLLDLGAAIDNWSFMGVDAAIKRFEKVTAKMCHTPKGVDRLFKIGWGYENRYPGLTQATKQYIKDISLVEWQAEWPFDELESSSLDLLRRKIADRIPFFKRNESLLRMCSKKVFFKETDIFIRNVMNLLVGPDQDKAKVFLTTNAFDPTNPFFALSLSGCLLNIVVDRDVRDIYADSVSHSPGFNDNVEKFSKITGAYDVEVFITRQRMLRETVINVSPDVASRNMTVYFEDLIYDVEATRKRLLAFIGLDAESQILGSRFDNKKSAKNVGKWQQLGSEFAPSIKRIEAELPDLCIQNKYQ